MGGNVAASLPDVGVTLSTKVGGRRRQLNNGAFLFSGLDKSWSFLVLISSTGLSAILYCLPTSILAL